MTLRVRRPPRTGAPPAPSPCARVLLRITLAALGARLALEAVGLASLLAHGQPPSRALAMWSQWDAPHYLRIAKVGYRPPTTPGEDSLFIVFFPLFPLAVHLVAFAVRNLVLSGLLVSFAASVGAAFLLWQLALRDGDQDRAWRAVVLLFTFPTAYFLAAPYSEALFLVGVLGAALGVRLKRWGQASAGAALATGTRVAGAAVLPALLVEAWVGGAGGAQRLRRLFWAPAGAAGLLIYLAINWIVDKNPLYFLRIQREHWYQHLQPPWQTMSDAVHDLAAGVGADHVRLFIVVGRLAGFVLAVLVLLPATRRMVRFDAVYAWGGLVLLLSTSWLISLPRYLLGLYPLFLAGSDATRPRTRLWTVALLGAGLQGWLFWRYAAGEWTF